MKWPVVVSEELVIEINAEAVRATCAIRYYFLCSEEDEIKSVASIDSHFLDLVSLLIVIYHCVCMKHAVLYTFGSTFFKIEAKMFSKIYISIWPFTFQVKARSHSFYRKLEPDLCKTSSLMTMVTFQCYVFVYT